MKIKQIFFLLVVMSIFISESSFAQNEIPNASFETWSGEDPDFWSTFNSNGEPNVVPDPDAFIGSLSARMEVIPGNAFPPRMQAHDGNGFPFPVSQNYNYLVGYYKFFPVENDPVYIYVGLHGDVGEGGKEGFLTIEAPAEEWTQFVVPIIEYQAGSINQGTISFQMENFPLHEGTYFLVDSLELLMELKSDDDPPIGVIREFADVRPAFTKFKGVRVATGDVNGDGISEIAIIQGCQLKLYNPVTEELQLIGDFDNDGPVDGSDYIICEDGNLTEGIEINLFGFLDFAGEKHALVTVDSNGNQIIAILIGVTNDETHTVGHDKTKVVGITNLPSGKTAILTYIEQDNIFKVIGEPAGNISNNISNYKSITYSNQSEYELELKFQSEPGLKLAYDPDLFDPPNDTDLDADGNLDIAMLKLEGGEPSGIIIRGGDNFDIIWDFTFPNEHMENILKGLHGFIDADGNGIKEAIFGDNLAVTLDGTVHIIAENFVIIDVNDIDNDGFEDIIGINTVDSSVVVYGINSSTSVADNYEAEIHFKLFHNYPNPFNPSTTISYSVAQPGEVDITIFNSLGQIVHRLVNETKPAGEYTITWDGRNEAGQLVSSGPYFYRLKVGELVQTKQMILLK